MPREAEEREQLWQIAFQPPDYGAIVALPATAEISKSGFRLATTWGCIDGLGIHPSESVPVIFPRVRVGRDPEAVPPNRPGLRPDCAKKPASADFRLAGFHMPPASAPACVHWAGVPADSPHPETNRHSHRLNEPDETGARPRPGLGSASIPSVHSPSRP